MGFLLTLRGWPAQIAEWHRMVDRCERCICRGQKLGEQMLLKVRASFSMLKKRYACRRVMVINSAICALSLILAASPQAQTYPERPVTLVVPFGPGSATDIFARVIAQNLSPILRQNVLVDNKPGGNATIAAEAVDSCAGRRLYADGEHRQRARLQCLPAEGAALRSDQGFRTDRPSRHRPLLHRRLS